MADLSTTYMGLRLRNPIMVSSSRLTSSLDGIKSCVDAGAGAVVLASLFEEQLMADTDKAISEATFLTHTEAEDYFVALGRNHYMDRYFRLVESAKKAVEVPVVASVNCISAETWSEMAGGFESSGADALELNVFILPSDPSRDSRALEAHYRDVVSRVKAKVKIPISLKIGFHFSAMAEVISSLSRSGVKGLVLFNRYYRPDFDIEGMRLKPAPIFSNPEESAIPLQWISLMSGRVGCDLAANTGIHDGAAVVKQLLAGARAVEVCTAVQKKGAGQLATMLADVSSWMKRHSFETVDAFRGKLSRESSGEPKSFERSQYLRGIAAPG